MDFTFLFFSIFTILAVAVAGALVYKKHQKRKKAFPPYTQAMTLMLNGEYEKALLILRDVVMDDSDNIEAYILYGDILRKLGYCKRAAKIHKELTVRDGLKPQQTIDIQRSLLLDFLEGKMYKEALSCADDMLSRTGSDLWTLQRQLEALEALSDWKHAAETARKIQNVTGKPDKELLAIYKVMEGMKILAEDGKEHDARLKFREAIKIDDRLAMPYLELADSYLRDERTEDAIKEWKQLFIKNPQKAYLTFDKLEATLFELNRFAELEKIYRNLIEEHSENTRAVAALAKFLHRKGETADAIRICQDGLELKPESLWLRRNLFRFLASDGKYKEATVVGLEVLKMVTKEKEEFACKNCGFVTHNPLWRCPQCGKWRSFTF